MTNSQRVGISRNSFKSHIGQFITMDRSLEEQLAMKDGDLEQLLLARQCKGPDQRYLELAAVFRIWR